MSSKNPLPTRRHPSSTSKHANPTAPPKSPTSHHPHREKHFIAIPFYTIEARARSFQGQVLKGITPLQLAQNGFYYEPIAPFNDMACCFACEAFVRLGSLQREPLQGRQRLHVDDCVWQVIYGELKQTLEPTNILHPSIKTSPPRKPTSCHHPSVGQEPPKKTTTDASTQTLVQSTPTVPNIIQKSLKIDLEPHSQPPPTTTNLERQQTPPIDSPQLPQPTPPFASSPKTQHITYASVLQRPVISTTELYPPTQESSLPVKPILTIEDLHRRFHNKPSPFQLENKLSQRSAKRTRNKTASATQSLSRFLASALPAFSRFLTEMQSKSDTCYPSHPQLHYSRAMRAA
ncbi:hypothetical protein N7495_001429 [Penicillium taxi]|uniref:uncharacterized protein n=1 Tax=Penicillium taxi TaxID=168475 RepID=UPI002544E691|nr:uncharacterized protein N7495_001429 [Penicillium taxi]KAJ5908747.1 hypothetical protein N7495_001429 [Penicillium taxi]